MHEHLQRAGMRRRPARARTQVSPIATPRSDAACHAIWSGRPRRKPIVRHAREQRDRSPRRRCRTPPASRARRIARFRAAFVGGAADARARAAAPGAWRCRGRPAAGPSTRSTASAMVPAMSAQVSRYRWSRRSRSATSVAKRWITSGSAMSCFCAVTDISRCWRTSQATSAVSPSDRPCAWQNSRASSAPSSEWSPPRPLAMSWNRPASSSSSGLRRRGQTSCASAKRSSGCAGRERGDVLQHRERVLVDRVDVEQVELHAPGHVRERRDPAAEHAQARHPGQRGHRVAGRAAVAGSAARKAGAACA